MEKLFSKDELGKIKTGSFNIQSLKKNGKELTACSFNRGCTGNALCSYVIKYNVGGEKIQDIFVSFKEKVSGNSIYECANNLRNFLNNKHNIIISSVGIDSSAIDALKNDYLTDDGVLYEGIGIETPNKKFPTKIIPTFMTTENINNAIGNLRHFVLNGRFHVNEDLYKGLLNELSLIEYEINDKGVIRISCDKREYIDNLLLICGTNKLLNNGR